VNPARPVSKIRVKTCHFDKILLLARLAVLNTPCFISTGNQPKRLSLGVGQDFRKKATQMTATLGM
jgi:hypothetical protein